MNIIYSCPNCDKSIKLRKMLEGVKHEVKHLGVDFNIEEFNKLFNPLYIYELPAIIYNGIYLSYELFLEYKNYIDTIKNESRQKQSNRDIKQTNTTAN